MKMSVDDEPERKALDRINQTNPHGVGKDTSRHARVKDETFGRVACRVLLSLTEGYSRVTPEQLLGLYLMSLLCELYTEVRTSFSRFSLVC